MKFTTAALLAIVMAKTPYFSSDAYLAESASKKSDDLWTAINKDTKIGGWYHVQMPQLFTESEAPTFDTPGDEMPQGSLYGYRLKLIHSVGAIAKVKFHSRRNHKYTGIFEGADYGFARLSAAVEPDTKVQSLAPGMGLKFVRDGIDSANMVAMYSVDGQPSWNFFANDFSNHIPESTAVLTNLLAAHFASETKWVTEVGLSDMARYDQSGYDFGDKVNFPYKLRFHPTGKISFPDTYVAEFTDQLMTIPSGSTLYEVYATDKPVELGGTETHIGDLITESEFTTSNWGDEHFFIRHQDFAEDL